MTALAIALKAASFRNSPIKDVGSLLPVLVADWSYLSTSDWGLTQVPPW